MVGALASVQETKVELRLLIYPRSQMNILLPFCWNLIQGVKIGTVGKAAASYSYNIDVHIATHQS